MQLLDLTMDSIAEDLALDEALLNEADKGERPCEVLRLWEPSQVAVVVGRSSRVGDEVNIEACDQMGVAVVRRSSGGGTIVAGPGCLMYSLVLSLQLRPSLAALDEAHRTVLGTNAAALQRLSPGTSQQGTSDLAVNNLKFSGNSMRVKQTHLLYHGTLLYDVSPALIANLLKRPPREPDYRAGRDHAQFVKNIDATAAQLRDALIAAWQPQSQRTHWPREEVRRLMDERYAQHAWHFRH